MLPISPRMRPPGLLGALPIFALGFALGLLTVHLYMSSSSSSLVTGPRPHHHTTTTTASPRPELSAEDGSSSSRSSSSRSSSSSRHEIPPVVHFVQLRRGPDDDAEEELHFSFEAYLALYAAYRAVRPAAIHLHTDFAPADVARARAGGSSWTRRLLTLFPHVLRVHHVVAPTHAGPPSSSSPGEERPGPLPILRVEHRSDLVRLEALSTAYPVPNGDAEDAEAAEGTGSSGDDDDDDGDDSRGGALVGGGIYLDWDVLTLRSPRPLLRSGFPFIAGRQPDGFLNNGILLARADSAALALLRRETPLAFDGGWITHSVALLTRLVTRLVASADADDGGSGGSGARGEGEVLVLDHKACAPFSWEQADVDVLLARHEGDPSSSPLVNTTTTTTTTDPGHRRQRRPWERDLGDAYFLHKFFNDVDDPPGYRGVSVPYVLARDSNYAVAAWPIVRDGIRDGFIDELDATL